ncbi:hypothetical protein OAK38_06040 [Verrucomicrobia bacterium]|nr:hypothetical protein [Verrucomicrobiota bacterium]
MIHAPEPYPDLARHAVPVKGTDGGWVIRLHTRVLGNVPIGPRLARGSGFPSMPTKAETRMEAEDLAARWNVWLMENKPSPKKRRKRRR